MLACSFMNARAATLALDRCPEIVASSVLMAR